MPIPVLTSQKLHHQCTTSRPPGRQRPDILRFDVVVCHLGRFSSLQSLLVIYIYFFKFVSADFAICLIWLFPQNPASIWHPRKEGSFSFKRDGFQGVPVPCVLIWTHKESLGFAVLYKCTETLQNQSQLP